VPLASVYCGHGLGKSARPGPKSVIFPIVSDLFPGAPRFEGDIFLRTKTKGLTVNQPEQSSHTIKLSDPAALVATVVGIGFLPKAPGTWASLAALPAAWAIHQGFGRVGLAAAVVAVFALGVWCAGAIVRRGAIQDPGAVVIDEVAGQWLTLLAVAPDVLLYGLGFALFRLFDIWKPWPVSWAERTFKGGLGVMIDDAFAALYAGAILFAVAVLWKG
jgi:phosphatidylglycerophosphatase A